MEKKKWIDHNIYNATELKPGCPQKGCKDMNPAFVCPDTVCYGTMYIKHKLWTRNVTRTDYDMDKYRMCTVTKYTKTFIHNLYRENVCHAFHTSQRPMRGIRPVHRSGARKDKKGHAIWISEGSHSLRHRVTTFNFDFFFNFGSIFNYF